MNRLIAILGMFLIVGSVAFGQDGAVRKAYALSISSRAEFQTWSKSPSEDKSYSVSQFSLPLSVKYAVTRDIAVDLISSTIFSSAEDNSLSGLRDLKARTVMMLADDRVMMSLGVNMPIGKSDLSKDGEAVSTLLADRSMKFRYSNLGEGFDISANGGVAQKIGSMVVGGGAGYLKKGEYKLMEGTDEKYHPGDQITVTAGTDLIAAPLLIRADATYTAYQPDKLNAEEVYQEESKIAIQGSAYLSTPKAQVLASGRYTLRGTPKTLQDESLEDDVSIYGNQADFRGYLRVPFTDALSGMLLTDLIIIGKNENDANDALVTGLGAGIGYRIGNISRISLEGRYYFGSADSGDSSLNGFSGLCSIRLSL